MNGPQPTEEDIFRVAHEITSPEARMAYLKQVCRDANEVERVVELLKAGAEDQSFLENGPACIDATEEMHTPVIEQAGESVGPYKLLQQIGEGGFGVVYMAEQTKPVRRKVALKVIKPGMDTKEVIARFEAERQALALMDHPNIAKIFDGGTTRSGRPYFVMQLVKGIPLTKFCDENKFDLRRRLELFATVCKAIQHAHHKGVIHRVIKPSNVLVTLHDGVPVPKVIDFGVSKAISQQLTEKTMFTAHGQMIGTPQYMSPEQAEMSGLDIDTRSDIYSLGILLYELMTGVTPLDPKKIRGTAYFDLQRMIREDEPVVPSYQFSKQSDQSATIATQRQSDPSKLGSQLKGELDWIVMKSLDKDRNRRYDSANAMAADVRII
ncbi:MAG: serine/threonine protein kinase [Pirellulales bacterium]